MQRVWLFKESHVVTEQCKGKYRYCPGTEIKGTVSNLLSLRSYTPREQETDPAAYWLGGWVRLSVFVESCEEKVVLSTPRMNSVHAVTVLTELT